MPQFSFTKLICYRALFVLTGTYSVGNLWADDTSCPAPFEFADSAQAETSQSAVLQEDFKNAFTHLDELAGTLQYLVQVVNTSQSFEGPQKRAVRVWALHHLGIIKTIKPSKALLNEQTLMAMIKNTRVLIIHLQSSVKNNLECLTPFTPPLIPPVAPAAGRTQADTDALYASFGSLLESNTILLGELKEAVSIVGLTTTNLIARKLDDLNTTYKITEIIELIPRIVGIGALALWLVKYDKVKDIPILGKIKRILGTSESLDPQGEVDIKYYGLDVRNAGKTKDQYDADSAKLENSNKTLGGFLKSDDRYTFAGYFATAGFLFNHEKVSEWVFPYKSWVRNYWNRLKGFNHKKIGSYRHPEITLDDQRLIGLESQIAQMRKIVGYITEPEKYDRTASGLEKGILLTGPSRSGKTLLAGALCGTINEKMQEKGLDHKFAFKEIKWQDISWSTEGIKSIITEAKQNAPCVLFIDELHNLPLQTKEGGKILSEFLAMGESLNSTGVGDTVIILAATNRPQQLDDALLKPGRFGLQIHFENPTCELRKKFFTVMCEKNALNPQDFNLDDLARQTENCSYGDLDLVFKNARFSAHNKGRDLRQEDFQASIIREINRVSCDEELPLTLEARALIAAHQAGHAFLYLAYEKQLNEHLETVTIRGTWSKISEKSWLDTKVHQSHHVKKIKYGKIFKSHNSEAIELAVDPRLKAKIYLAGSIAEKVLLGTTSYSYHPKDMRKALKELEKITMKGLAEEDFTKEELTEPKKEAKLLLADCEKEVTEFFTKNKEALKRLAGELNKRTVLRHDEVKEILENQLK